MTWRRRPGLAIDATAADGSYSEERGAMVTKHRDRAGLAEEIMLKLAIYLAGLDEDGSD